MSITVRLNERPAAPMTVTAITSLAQWKSTIDDPAKLHVVNFSAQWSGPCNMLSPLFTELSQQYPTLSFLSVDVDDMSEVAEEAHISATPTFQVWRGGALLKAADARLELVGANPSKLQELVKMAAAAAPSR